MNASRVWAPPRPISSGRSTLLPLLAMTFFVSLAVGAVGMQGLERSDAAVKGFLLLALGTAAGALVWYRPVLFPLSAYVVAVPFDNMLQTGNGTITKFLAIASVGIIVLLLVDPRRRAGPPLAVLAWGAYMTWAVSSLLWSESVQMGWAMLVMLLSLYATYVVTALLRVRLEELRFLSGAIVVGGLASVAYGFWMYLQGTDMSAAGDESRLTIVAGDGSNVNFAGHAGSINSDHFAAALVLPIAFALVLVLERRWSLKLLGAGLSIALLFGIFISATRASLVAVGVMVLYLAIIHRRRIWLIGLAVCTPIASLPFPAIWARFQDPTQAEAGGRLPIWKIGFNAFTNHWLYGVGIGQFRVAYAESYLHVRLPPSSVLIHSWYEDSHNMIVSNAVELGIVGLILFLTAWFFQFRTTRHIGRDSPLYGYRLAAETGAIGLFTVAMTLDLMQFKYVWLAFMLGVLVRNAASAVPESALRPSAIPPSAMPARGEAT